MFLVLNMSLLMSLKCRCHVPQVQVLTFQEESAQVPQDKNVQEESLQAQDACEHLKESLMDVQSLTKEVPSSLWLIVCKVCI